MRLWQYSEQASTFRLYGMEIKRARKRLRLSREEVASFVGLSPRTISDYENGRSRPSKEVALKIQEKLGVKPIYLDLSRERTRNITEYHQRTKAVQLLDKKLSSGLLDCEEIEALRLRKEMTQAKFAAWLGLPYRSYVNLVRGRNVTQKREHVKIIKEKLGINIRTVAFVREQKKHPRVSWGMATLGERVRMIRRLRGYSLQDLSKRSGVCKSALSFLENNKKKPRKESLSFIFTALDISADEMQSKFPPFVFS